MDIKSSIFAFLAVGELYGKGPRLFSSLDFNFEEFGGPRNHSFSLSGLTRSDSEGLVYVERGVVTKRWMATSMSN